MSMTFFKVFWIHPFYVKAYQCSTKERGTSVGDIKLFLAEPALEVQQKKQEKRPVSPVCTESPRSPSDLVFIA